MIPSFELLYAIKCNVTIYYDARSAYAVEMQYAFWLSINSRLPVPYKIARSLAMPEPHEPTQQ